MKTKRTTTIPFSGFYESYHSYQIDDCEAQMFQNDHGDPNGKLSERLYWLVNYSHVFRQYAKDYAENFAHEFKIALKFESLSSPREYNFTTDRIFCYISRKEVRRLYKEVNKEALRDLAKRRFTSRDGFHSFYSPDVESWGSIDSWDWNQIGTLIEAYVGDFEESELACQNGNCEIENWITDSVPTEKKPELQRLFDIYSYLRHREERNQTWYYKATGQTLLAV